MYQNRLSQEAPGLRRHIPFVHPSARSKLNQSFDSMLLMVLACFGIIGFCYVFYCFANPELGSGPKNFTFIQSSLPFASPNQDSTTNDLEISGNFEANQPMTFTLSSFNPKISYIIDFGDGEEMILNKDHCKYTYKNQGSYQLKMKALFNQKAQILYTKTLNIKAVGNEEGEMNI